MDRETRIIVETGSPIKGIGMSHEDTNGAMEDLIKEAKAKIPIPANTNNDLVCKQGASFRRI